MCYVYAWDCGNKYQGDNFPYDVKDLIWHKDYNAGIVQGY